VCGGDAFAGWAAADPLGSLRDRAVKRAAILPLLLRAAPPGTDAALLSVLRAARAHEELRVGTIRAACADVLAQEDEPALVVGGVALAATAYDEWPLRHCHDLDLLVRSGAGESVHPSGLPVVRHARLHPRGRPVGGVRDRAVGVTVAGVEARVLAPTDALVHVLGRAARGLGSLRWAVDAAVLARRHPDLDPRVAAEHAAATRAARPVAALARFVRDELGAPLAPELIDALGGAGRRLGRLGATRLTPRRRG
jgi:hypothetical protein